MKNLDCLSEKEFKNVSKTWFSIYPLIYYKTQHFKNIQPIKNQDFKRIFNLFLKAQPNSLYQMSELFYNNINIFLSCDISKEVLIDMSKTFFAYDFNTKKFTESGRISFLKKSYSKDDLENIFWRHDGWWNCYYGKLKDIAAKNILVKEYNKNSNYDILKQIKIGLTLAYRLSELNKVKLAKKLLRKTNRFLTFKFNREVSIPVYIKTFPSKIIYRCFRAFQDVKRYRLNILMFLYRAEENKFKQKRLIKKILRKNSLHKHFNFGIQQMKYIKIFSRNILNMRPQHILKLIEIRIDLYNLTKKEYIINEIQFLLKEFLKTIRNEYYPRLSEFINYFIISEFYLTIFYYLEKVHNVDIQDF